jgi:putative membrane protein
MVFSLILALVIAIVAVFFALENTMQVTVSFFGYGVDGSLALFILIGLGVGILVGVLFMTPGRIKSSLSNARHRKKIGSLEASLDEQKYRLAALEKTVPPDTDLEPPESD